MQEVPFARSQYLAGRFRADTEVIANTRQKGSGSNNNNNNNNALALAVTVCGCKWMISKRRKGEADWDICIIIVRGLHVVSTVIRILVNMVMYVDAIKLSTNMRCVLIMWYERGATNISAVLGYLHTLAILVCTHRDMQDVPCIPTACSVSGERVWLFDARMFLLQRFMLPYYRISWRLFLYYQYKTVVISMSLRVLPSLWDQSVAVDITCLRYCI